MNILIVEKGTEKVKTEQKSKKRRKGYKKLRLQKIKTDVQETQNRVQKMAQQGRLLKTWQMTRIMKQKAWERTQERHVTLQFR